MKKRSLFLTFLLMVTVGLLAACGSSESSGEGEGDSGSSEGEGTTDFKVAMVTDVGGVDDKSFNQSAWEGLKALGSEEGLTEGEGFTYLQSQDESDYKTNLNQLIKRDYNLVFGIGYKLHDAIEEVAGQQSDKQFAIVDDVVEQDNVASIMFEEQQGSFLVGVAAAMKSESGKVGFIGGMESPLITKFEVGFVAGVKSVNPDAEVDVQYAGAFDQPATGKSIASTMYSSGVDVIYHASGATGNGAFAEAKDRKKNDPSENIYMIGVDRDQHEEGEVPGEDTNITLTSMVKRVDVAVQDVSKQAMDGEFPGGEVLQFGLDDEAISVATTNEEAYTDEIASKVDEWKEKIKNDELTVPKTQDELQEYVSSL
ncbi:membrane protein [Pontibacillus halophilus JSM 076056 = DSM 19796]|uniref:Membrane protein n=1 Tax=Pontibacillus halophilus JSM 076056 = DSM 19796 TaxID=1385510 RepID=A0A0A5GMB9_9BACI|nr:BMP family protein [Pontibacillus halophilus]KGX93114.1 membrane protein [Pontibacillus halophilus JSM 076056 = DSM 19796]